MTTPRLLVIGLDAADKDLIEQWAREGVLPNFFRLLGTSLQGDVENPRGLEAGACWPTFYYGLQPGETGQFDGDRHFDVSMHEHVPFHPQEDWQPPIWSTLSQAGKLCAVIDAPYNNVTSGINGIKIVDRGAHIPAGGGEFMNLRTHPEALAGEIERLFGPDPADGHCSEHFQMDTAEQVNTFRDIYKRRIINKTSLVLHYWQSRQWDFFMSVFTEAHCAGHRCWHIHDSRHPAHDPALAREVGNPLRDIYMELDRAVGRIIDAVRDEAQVIVYLSHGMGPRHTGTQMLDRILARLDTDPLAAQAQGTAGVARRSLWRGQPQSLRRPLTPQRRHVANGHAQTDRRGRRFFEVFANDRTAGIRINLKGREAEGIVNNGKEFNTLCRELTRDLLNLRNAETGEPLVNDVMRVRDWHRGQHINRLPDLLVTWNRSHPINAAVSDKTGFVDMRGIATHRTGDHRTTGRFFAVSPDWSYRKLSYTVKAEDFAPTIAHLLGVELEKTDGRRIPCLTTRRVPLQLYSEECFYTLSESRL